MEKTELKVFEEEKSCDFCSKVVPLFSICVTCKKELLEYANEGDKHDIKSTLALHNRHIYFCISQLVYTLETSIDYIKHAESRMKSLLLILVKIKSNYYNRNKDTQLICTREEFKRILAHLAEIQMCYEEKSKNRILLELIRTMLKTIMFNQEIYR